MWCKSRSWQRCGASGGKLASLRHPIMVALMYFHDPLGYLQDSGYRKVDMEMRQRQRVVIVVGLVSGGEWDGPHAIVLISIHTNVWHILRHTHSLPADPMFNQMIFWPLSVSLPEQIGCILSREVFLMFKLHYLLYQLTPTQQKCSYGLSANSLSCGTLGTSPIYDSTTEAFFCVKDSNASRRRVWYVSDRKKMSRKKIGDDIKKHSSFYCFIDLWLINSTLLLSPYQTTSQWQLDWLPHHWAFWRS